MKPVITLLLASLVLSFSYSQSNPPDTQPKDSNLVRLDEVVLSANAILGSKFQAKNRTGIVSFTMVGVHPHDLAQFLGAENLALRAGHHCTQPLLDGMGVAATVRASFSIYNTMEEVDQLVEVLKEIKEFWV